MIGRITSFAAIAALILSFALLANAATDPGVACAVAKHKAAAKKFSDKAKCHATALKKGVAVDAACLTKAAGKFDTSFAKAEDKGGCVTTATSDAPTIELLIDDTLAAVLESLPSDATDPGVACAVSKQKAAAKKLSEKVKCHGTALKKGVAVDGACLTKAAGKFDDSFAKAEDKGGCVTTADAAAIETIIDELLGYLLDSLPSATTTSTSTTTTMLPPPSCPVGGDHTACTAYSVTGSTCEGCCNFLGGQACGNPCFAAVFGGLCGDDGLNNNCATAINASGCAAECCP